MGTESSAIRMLRFRRCEQNFYTQEENSLRLTTNSRTHSRSQSDLSLSAGGTLARVKCGSGDEVSDWLDCQNVSFPKISAGSSVKDLY